MNNQEIPKNLRICIVEDDENMAFFIGEELKDEIKAKITHVIDGNEAIAELENERFDLVISDTDFPHNESFRWYCDHYNPPKIILMSAGTQEMVEGVIGRKLEDVTWVNSFWIKESDLSGLFDQIRKITKQ